MYCYKPIPKYFNFNLTKNIKNYLFILILRYCFHDNNIIITKQFIKTARS